MKIRLAALGLLVTVGACSSIRPVLVPQEFIPQQQPELIWVVDETEETIPLQGASIRSDSIVGIVGNGLEIGVPLTSARMVLARQPDRKKTTYFLVGMGAVAGLTAWRFMAGSGAGTEGCYFIGGKEKRC